MGKTRIAAYVANAVARSGGRCAVLIPPGLGFQWQAEFRACGTGVPQVIRSLQGYYEAWDEAENDAKIIAPWFKQPCAVVISLRDVSFRQFQKRTSTAEPRVRLRGCRVNPLPQLRMKPSSSPSAQARVFSMASP
jgi:hypothetical protein